MSERPAIQPMDALILDDGRVVRLRPHACFACGELNLQGLQLQLHYEAGTCWVETELDPRFNGWEGIVHGGIVCAILDEVMAWSLIEADCLGLTARLAVEFKRPIRVGQRVRGEGRLVDRRRRVLRTEGQIIDADSGEVFATATATYVDAPDDQKAAWRRRYGFRVVAAPSEP